MSRHAKSLSALSKRRKGGLVKRKSSLPQVPVSCYYCSFISAHSCCFPLGYAAFSCCCWLTERRRPE